MDTQIVQGRRVPPQRLGSPAARCVARIGVPRVEISKVSVCDTVTLPLCLSSYGVELASFPRARWGDRRAFTDDSGRGVDP